LAGNINPKIAVLLPVFKGVKYLSKQIDSIIKQKKIDLHIYLSVDPCADGSIEYVNRIKKKNKNIKVLKHSKLFRTPTKHFFFLISQINEKDYDYIGLSDQDDIWFDDKIFKSIQLLKAKKVDCYSGSVIAFNDKKKKNIIKSTNQTKYDYFFESAGPGSTYLMSQKFVKNFKKFIFKNKSVLLFRNYDWLIYAFARNNNYKWLIDQKPSLYYRQHQSNFIGARWSLGSIYYRFKEVISGRAYKEVNYLVNLFISKKDIKENNKFENNFYLLKNSFYFRRKISDKILLFFYFLTTLLFGSFKNNTFHFSLNKIFKNFLILAFLFIGKDFFYIYAEKLKVFSISEHLNIFLMFSIIMLFVAWRYLVLINSTSNKNLNFFYWYKVFVEGQIMSIFLPYTSFFYRFYYLNKVTVVSLENLFKLTVFIFIQEQLILSMLVLVNIFLFNNNLLIINSILIILLLIIFYIFVKNFNFMIGIFIKFFNRFNFLKNYNFKLDNISFKDMIKVSLITLLKIFTSGVLFYFVAQTLNIKLDFSQILIIIFINEVLQNLKITPQNIGVSEIFFGFMFQFVFASSLVNGVLYKIHHRVLETFFYVIMSLILKIVAVSYKKYKYLDL
jgi:rhamnosyltransferase